MNHAYLDRRTVPSDSIMWRPQRRPRTEARAWRRDERSGDLTSWSPLQKGVYAQIEMGKRRFLDNRFLNANIQLRVSDVHYGREAGIQECKLTDLQVCAG